jgi:hypothetical protein
MAQKGIYTLKFCFFVVMGGFQVSIKDIYPGPDSHHERREIPEVITLSAEGIVQLAELGRFVLISSSKIEDRSKADTIQKALVMMQVGWMALQCAYRGAVRLPISLLEIHTLVHVACAMSLYLFWIKVSLIPTAI